MALSTSNLYGKIVVTEDTIRTVVGATTLEGYGVYGLDGMRGKRACERHLRRAIRVDVRDNRIYIEVNVILKYGVSIDAVTESIRGAIRYNVELFAGTHVEVVNINVLGIK